VVERRQIFNKRIAKVAKRIQIKKSLKKVVLPGGSRIKNGGLAAGGMGKAGQNLWNECEEKK
jgi:hypothetical protein